MLIVTVLGNQFTTTGNLQMRFDGSLFYNATIPTSGIQFGAKFRIVRTGASQIRSWGLAGTNVLGAGAGATQTKTLTADNVIQAQILGSGGSGAVWSLTVELVKA
jgi:hypothetical protein